MPALSAVVPVYGCTECLRALHARLADALDSIDRDWEIVYVDDCSPGESWPLLVELAKADPRVRACHLRRNSGQSAAIAAGLANSEGAHVVVMDCDLQDPPEAIARLHAAATGGAEIVLTVRPEPSYGLARRLGTAAYLRLRRAGSEGPQPRYSSFSLISRRVGRAVLCAADRNRSYLMTLHSLDFPRTALEIPREERHAGESSYTLGRLVRVGLGNLWSQYRPRGGARSGRGPLYEVDMQAPARDRPERASRPATPEPAGRR